MMNRKFAFIFYFGCRAKVTFPAKLRSDVFFEFIIELETIQFITFTAQPSGIVFALTRAFERTKFWFVFLEF